MNWEALGAIGEIVGGFVVVATIVYLSRQIRESNKHAKAEAERDVQSHWTGIVDSVLRDPVVRATMRKGYDSFEALSGDEKTVFQLFVTHALNHLEMVLRMERDGLLAPDIADTYRTLSLSILRTPGGRECWNMASGVYQDLSTKHIKQGLISSEGAPLTETLPFWSAQSNGNS